MIDTALDAWLRKIEAMHPREIELGLDRIRSVALTLGVGKPAPCVVTVAGTNGKGSTVAFIESIARAAGLKTGAYTSPHILAFSERIRINGTPVPDVDLIRSFERIEAAQEGVALTYFEYATLTALLLFESAGVDIAILEVGLGGRLDAVNLVDADVAVVTTVDIDHADWLGDNRETIGAEKIEIARAGKPVVLGDDDPPASVLRRAYALGASAIRINCDFFFGRDDVASWHWRSLGVEMQLPMPALQAPVQLRNAAVAIAALQCTDLVISESAYAEGIANANVAARLQRMEKQGIPVYLDVAHNPQAAGALADWLRGTRDEGRVLGVFAMLEDKDADAVVRILGDAIDHWWLAGLAGPRGQSAEMLRGRVSLGNGDVTLFETVAEALDAAIDSARPNDRVLVFGSFHTVAEAFMQLSV